ncbi:MAG: hypothetical protein HY978_04090 [Candidatus Liptonbacteria bacterium]|nr:hypothetical protein [Candidatus Liptonbacteria bacterium]
MALEVNRIYEGCTDGATQRTQRVVLAIFGDKIHYWDFGSKRRNTVPCEFFVAWLNRQPVQHPRHHHSAAA